MEKSKSWGIKVDGKERGEGEEGDVVVCKRRRKKNVFLLFL